MKKLVLLFLMVLAGNCFGQIKFTQPFYNFGFTGLIEYQGKILVSTWDTGVWESSDNGKTFNRISYVDTTKYHETNISGQLFIYGNNIVAQSKNKNSDNLYSTTNGGKDWKFENVISSFCGKNCIYKQTKDGLFKSNNDLTNWEKLPLDTSIKDLRLSFVFDDTIFMHTFNNENNKKGTYYTDDKGLNWHFLNNFDFPYLDNYDCQFKNQINNTLFYAYNDTLIIIKDNGKTWERKKIPGNDSMITFINVKKDTLIAVISDYQDTTVYISTDMGITFDTVKDNKKDYYYTYIESGNNIYKYRHDLFISNDKGENWFTPNNPLITEINDLYICKDYALVTSNDSKVLKSTDNLKTWQETFMPEICNSTGYLFRDSNGTLYVTAESEDLYMSTNDGDYWEWVYTFNESDANFRLYNNTLYYHNPKLTYSNDNGMTWDTVKKYADYSFLFGKSNTLFLYKSNYYYKTTDDFSTVNSLTMGNKKYLRCYDDTLFSFDRAVESCFLYYSIDDGDTWENYGLNFPSMPEYQDSSYFLSYYKKYKNIFVSTTNYGEIYISIDYGRSWTKIHETRGKYWAKTFLKIFEKMLYRSYYYEGLSFLDLEPLLESSAVTEKPDESKNDVKVYPNPTKDFISYNINLINDADVCVEIYDISGRLVKENNQGYLAAGQHTLFSPVFDLSSGKYIISVSIGGEKLISTFEIVR